MQFSDATSLRKYAWVILSWLLKGASAMPQTYRALDVAKWFIAWADANEADLSNMKLQKLLYYAQGLHLAAYDTPLFQDSIQAWSHGPVVASVYHQYKSAQSADLSLAGDADFTFESFDDETNQFFIGVWKTYGGIATWKLREMSHQELPWLDFFQPEVRDIEIPMESIKSYFKSLV